MGNENVINLQDFEQNKIPLKQRSFEDSNDTFLSLFDADLLLIWMNNFWHSFRFHSASCPVLHIVLIISRGECSLRQTKNYQHCYYPVITFKRLSCLAFDIKTTRVKRGALVNIIKTDVDGRVQSLTTFHLIGKFVLQSTLPLMIYLVTMYHYKSCDTFISMH